MGKRRMIVSLSGVIRRSPRGVFRWRLASAPPGQCSSRPETKWRSFAELVAGMIQGKAIIMIRGLCSIASASFFVVAISAAGMAPVVASAQGVQKSAPGAATASVPAAVPERPLPTGQVASPPVAMLPGGSAALPAMPAPPVAPSAPVAAPTAAASFAQPAAGVAGLLPENLSP